MTYGTMNPLGSTDPRDLYDNAQSLDNAVNSASPLFSDRFGTSRKTLSGALASIATITNRGNWAPTTAYQVKDIVLQGGSWYVCVIAHTSSAAFATDEASKWRIYQGVIAGELAASGGAGMVGYQATSVYAYLESGLVVECADATEEAAAWAAGAKIVLRSDLLISESAVTYLKFDGTEGSSLFTDASLEGHLISVVGSPTMTTAQKKFGTAGMDFSGVGNYLSIADDGDSLRLFETWTVECWHKFKTAHIGTTQVMLFAKGVAGSLTALWYGAILANGKLAFSSGNNTVAIYVDYPYVNDTTNWHHISFCCVNNVLTAYVDGVSVGSATLGTGGLPLMASSQSLGPLTIGCWNYSTANTEGDYMDDFIILKGLALHTGNFTPPTVPFSGILSGDAPSKTFRDVNVLGLVNTAGQVKFPALANPSTDPNTLDDYEEGSFTPTFTCNTPGDLAVTYGTRVGRYTKVGRLVTVNVSIAATITHTTASSIVKLTDLPSVLIASVGQFGALGAFQNFTSAGFTQLGWQAAQTAEIYITKSGSGLSFTNALITDFPSGGTVMLYMTASYIV